MYACILASLYAPPMGDSIPSRSSPIHTNTHTQTLSPVDGTILLWDATNVEIIEVKVSAKKKEKELIDDLYSFKPLFKINSTRPNTGSSLSLCGRSLMRISAASSTLATKKRSAQLRLSAMPV